MANSTKCKCGEISDKKQKTTKNQSNKVTGNDQRREMVFKMKLDNDGKIQEIELKN